MHKLIHVFAVRANKNAGSLVTQFIRETVFYVIRKILHNEP